MKREGHTSRAETGPAEGRVFEQGRGSLGYTYGLSVLWATRLLGRLEEPRVCTPTSANSLACVPTLAVS